MARDKRPPINPDKNTPGKQYPDPNKKDPYKSLPKPPKK